MGAIFTHKKKNEATRDIYIYFLIYIYYKQCVLKKDSTGVDQRHMCLCVIIDGIFANRILSILFGVYDLGYF